MRGGRRDRRSPARRLRLLPSLNLFMIALLGIAGPSDPAAATGSTC